MFLVFFRGILPFDASSDKKEPDIAPEKMEKFLSNLRELREFFYKEHLKIDYLGPFREKPRRIYEIPESGQVRIGARGEKTPELLARDYIQNRGLFLSRVGSWYAEHLGGWQLDLSKQGNYFSLVLRNPKNPELEVNIADAGTGLAQVLPIVVGRLFESETKERDALEIVEQPGLHLHPGAHGPLAELYVEAIKSGFSRCLIETHSANFLLRIRRRIADGTIKPDDVIVYWVNDDLEEEERIRPIRIDQNGDVDYWPERVFSEDFEEVREIRRATRKKK